MSDDIDLHELKEELRWKLPKHFWISYDGHLNRMRNPSPGMTASSDSDLIRLVYSKQFAEIKKASELKATLRAGAFATGGYPMFFLVGDGATLCFDCVRAELRNVLDSIKREIRDGWRVTHCDVNWEDNQLYCDHCSNRIPSAYGDDEQEDKGCEDDA